MWKMRLLVDIFFTKGTITSVSVLTPKPMWHTDTKRHLFVDKTRINR